MNPGFDSATQYLDWEFAGPDIVAAVRAGYNGSVTYHDASRLLVATVQGYADLCGGVGARGRGFGLGALVDGQVPVQLQLHGSGMRGASNAHSKDDPNAYKARGL